MSVRLIWFGWVAIFGLCVTSCAVRMGGAGGSPPPATAAQPQAAPAASSAAASPGSTADPNATQPTAQAGQPQAQGAQPTAQAAQPQAQQQQPAAASAPAAAAAPSQAAGPGEGPCFDANHQRLCPEERVRTDANELAQALQRLQELTRGGRYRLQEGGASPSVDQIRSKLAVMREVHAMATLVRPLFARFTRRHVSNAPAGSSSTNTLNSRFRGIADHVSSQHTELEELLRQIGQAGTTSARVCLETAGMELEHIGSRNEMLRARILGTALAMLEICPQYDPGNAAIARQAAQLRPRLAELQQRYRELELQAARERRWERNVGRVSAGAPAGLARAGLAFLRGHENWGRNQRQTRVMAVSVRGDWVVATRDIFGRPAQFGLPVHVAITNDGTAEELAQVYELTLVTRGPQKTANFREYWVGNTWFIMRSAVPGGGR